MNPLNCVCIKWGAAYSTDYVNRLFRAVKRNTERDVRFFCMTETADGLDAGINHIPLTEQPYEADMLKAQKHVRKTNGALRKIAIFNPALFAEVNGPVLALDLDIVITGNLDDLYDFSPEHVCMRGPFAPDAKPHTFGEGSVVKFDPKLHGFLYDEMASDPVGAVNAAQGSEQTYTSSQAHSRGVFSEFPEEWIVSFKRHCRPKRPFNLFHSPVLPENARIACFHGAPNVDAAENGYRTDPLHSTRKCQWITDHWY